MSAGGGRGVYFGDVTDRAGPDHFGGGAGGIVRVTLVAHLRGNLVFNGGVAEEAGFPGSAGEWLFDIDVNAALHGIESDSCVHVVGDADGAGVDVLAFLVEHDAEVFVLGGF